MYVAELCNLLLIYGRLAAHLVMTGLEILAPATTPRGCTDWAAVPVGKHYLGIGVSDLKRIIKSNGDSSSTPIALRKSLPPRYNPSHNSLFESCNSCAPPPSSSSSSSLSSDRQQRGEHINPVQEAVPT